MSTIHTIALSNSSPARELNVTINAFERDNAKVLGGDEEDDGVLLTVGAAKDGA